MQISSRESVCDQTAAMRAIEEVLRSGAWVTCAMTTSASGKQTKFAGANLDKWLRKTTPKHAGGDPNQYDYEGALIHLAHLCNEASIRLKRIALRRCRIG